MLNRGNAGQSFYIVIVIITGVCIHIAVQERIKSSRSQAPQDKSGLRARIHAADVTSSPFESDKKGMFTVKSRRVDRASPRCDQCSDISGESAMRSLPGINEAIISCHRELVAPSRAPSRLGRGCATIYFPRRYAM